MSGRRLAVAALATVALAAGVLVASGTGSTARSWAWGAGTPGVPIPDSEYDLWDVRVDNVTAHVKEIWVLEYRYRGAGVARGTFRVQPARYYEVKPTSLELAGGKLTLGDAVVAERANARIDVTVTGSETQKLSGLAPLKHITASAVGRFAGTELRFLNAYLGPHEGWSAGGKGDIELGVRVERSEERRVGKECERLCRSRWSPYH